MPPYNTRSAARQRALEPYKNAIVSSSATGKGTHIRWTYSSGEEVPSLSASSTVESEASFDRPATPDQDEDNKFQRSPTACSVEISDDSASSVVEDDTCRAAERALVERMFAELQQQKKVAEERVMQNHKLCDAAGGLDDYRNQQVRSNRPVNQSTGGIRNISGPKLPLGVTGFGRTGTWVVDDVWRPEFVSSTNRLPSIREFGEEQEVQSLLLSGVTQEDLRRGGSFGMLTPLPSFVTGNGDVRMR
jgi:hypothetical protein